MSELRRGYTTGVCAVFAFKSALESYLATSLSAVGKVTKMDNDDLDVTKGCEIVVKIAKSIDELELNPIKHFSYRIKNINIYAGRGVGVVTKKGLKPPQGYPAINPTPLKAIERVIQRYEFEESLFCSVSVSNGEEIAKQTANQKVGVEGGISILGTTGFVKPISSTAYLDSIKTEIEFIKAQKFKLVAFTLGNTSYKRALEEFEKEQIVEIGNFIYDSIMIAFELGLHIKFFVGMGKAVKIAQGFKNTHNRFGSIDFGLVQKWCGVNLKGIKTIKRVCEIVDEESFRQDIKKKAKDRIKKWFDKEIEICLL